MSGRYASYPEYSNTNASRLRAVPVSWIVRQLKRSVEGCVNGVWGTEPTGGADDVIVLRVADFDRPRLRILEGEFTIRSVPAKDREHRRLLKGDLLLEKSGGGERTPVGQVVRFEADFEAVCSNFVAKLTPRRGYDGAYLNYAFCSLYSDGVNTCSIKQNTGIQNLDSSAYLAEKLAFPSLDEQIQIAKFLDYETARIDALIEKQQQLIELLKEKRQAVISHAVTKGLNPDAPMRDSGVEWLGKVPAHWEIAKLIHLTSRIGDGLHGTPVYEEGTGLYFVNGNNLENGRVVLGETAREVPRTEFDRNFIQMSRSTVLLSINGTIGKVALYRDEQIILGKSAAYMNCLPRLDPRFLQVFFESSHARRYYELLSTGTTISNLSLDSIRHLSIGVPSLQEQSEISNYCTRQTEKYNRLINSAARMAEVLQERRTALISAAVTGKIDVRNWTPPTSDPEAEVA